MKEPKKIEDPFFVRFIYELCERNDEFHKRTVIISPYFGSYSEPAGFVITVQGTPPKATIFFPLDSFMALIKSTPVKVISFNTDYDRLVGFLRRHEIDTFYNIKLQ